MTSNPKLRTSRRRGALAAVLAALAAALAVAACGGSDSTSSASPTQSSAAAPPATTAAAMTTAAAPATTTAGTIADVAAANPDLSTLLAAVQQAGLAGTLSGPGPFTVFAPTNDAFAAALTALHLTQEQLLASPDLASILTYHVLPEKVMAADITAASNPATVQGETVDVKPVSDGVMVNDATVTTADIAASNGVIHIVDKVLLPPTVATKLGAG
jgi:transforming growth factor-beta-induced protein